jgi:ornithine carbamoyltransferase
MLGAHMRVATPKGFSLPADVAQAAERIAVQGAELKQYVDPKEAVKGADAIYTDVWTSMGQEVEYAERTKIFSRYQVNDAMMARAMPGALFMHCLPAHRGQEVTDEVIESSISVAFDQAENRLHAQKAMLVGLFADAR